MNQDSKTYEGVWIFAEQRRRRLLEITLEVLGGAMELAERLNTETSAILMGLNVGSLAEELLAYGVDKVFLLDHPLLEMYQSDAYAKLLAELVDQHRPEILLMGATSTGEDLAPRVAAKVQTGLSAHIVGLEIDEEKRLRQIVPGFGGNAMVAVVCPFKRPQMATIRAGVLKKPPRKQGERGEILKVDVDLSEKDLRARTLEIKEETPERPIEEAETVIAGGWGMRAAGGFKMLEDLAAVLGGSIGGTRPAVDEGWIGEDRMIGQSGKTVRPELYIGVGISGQMHHTVGILDSGVIVAVNIDPDAPIFKVADIGVVGDLRRVVPHLIDELRRFMSR
ncbi:MAG: electron transfer flavoprotein subunit alpha/FixB family protein [Candidatus Geothermarchaeales archaeon]